VRLVVLIRHGESVLNAAGIVNGDPHRHGPLTATGEAQARRLRRQLRNMGFDVAICTRFARTRQTAELALEGMQVPLAVEPHLDDINVGALDGGTIFEYRRWKRHHARGDVFPGGGESLDAAAKRYAHALRSLCERDERAIAVFCHAMPIRYALDAGAGAPALDVSDTAVPHATPFLFDQSSLAHAADQLAALAAAAARRSA
jgi:probable phosphoglycerate mutase